MRPLLIIALCFGLMQPSAAQVEGASDSTAILKVVTDLFDAMRDGDSAKAAALFHPDHRMLTVYKGKDGKTKLHHGNLQEFLSAIAAPHDDLWDEQIFNTHIKVDGDLGNVWTSYNFYLGEQFSHCGVDVFTMVKVEGKWLIVSLFDTRKTAGCR